MVWARRPRAWNSRRRRTTAKKAILQRSPFAGGVSRCVPILAGFIILYKGLHRLALVQSLRGLALLGLPGLALVKGLPGLAQLLLLQVLVQVRVQVYPLPEVPHACRRHVPHAVSCAVKIDRIDQGKQYLSILHMCLFMFGHLCGRLGPSRFVCHL